jgi:hypothetical protein
MKNHDSKFPGEINKFNWGACCLAILWSLNFGLYFHAFIAWLFPVLGWVYVGFTGNKALWQKGKPSGFLGRRPWNSIEEFHKSQKIWMILGLTLWSLIAFPFFYGFILGVMARFNITLY